MLCILPLDTSLTLTGEVSRLSALLLNLVLSERTSALRSKFTHFDHQYRQPVLTYSEKDLFTLSTLLELNFSIPHTPYD